MISQLSPISGPPIDMDMDVNMDVDSEMTVELD